LSEKYVYHKNIKNIQIEWGTKASDLFQQRRKYKEGHKNGENLVYKWRLISCLGTKTKKKIVIWRQIINF